MKQELTRSFAVLKTSPTPAYFLSYQLTDNRAISVTSSFGALTSNSDYTTRLLDIDLRVGDYKLDSTHSLRREPNISFSGETQSLVPIEDDPEALAVALWIETDRHYRYALQRFDAVRTERQLKATSGSETLDEAGADFSKAPAEQYSETIAPFSFDQKKWEEKVRKYGQIFHDNPDFQSATITAQGEIETRRYVNSEGSEIRMSMPLYHLTIAASIRANDGEILPLHRDFMSFEPDGLPSDEVVFKAVKEVHDELLALQRAPVAEPYTGPAILSGRASAVFFHEIFGHRIEGDRLKDESDAQTFKNKIHESVLPDFISVYSDPTMRKLRGTDLVGYYPFDDEGVRAHRVVVVNHGVFQNFLLSRSPLTGFPESNAHGRRQQGHHVVARQSNLIVEASHVVSHAELKKMLLARIKKSGSRYGLLIEDISGGFTFTDRSSPNAFKVIPTVVYQVYADGHEQLVRGLDMIGTPLIAFSKIAAADDSPGIFNGVCGAESGYVPVSASAPGLLVDQIEIQRKPKPNNVKPILAAPQTGAVR
jgi:predicted Zn-dependent protease